MNILTVKNISGVILAGGVNKRFGGRTKANELIGDRKIIDRIVDVLGEIFDELILITNSPWEFSDFSGIIAGDFFQGKGPLGGIHSAFRNSSGDAIFVFAGDMPFLDRDLIVAQANYFKSNRYDVILPAVDGKQEPLHGIYSKSVSLKLEEYLSSHSNLAIKAFLSEISVGLFELENNEKTRRAFTNINTDPEALEASRQAGIV